MSWRASTKRAFRAVDGLAKPSRSGSHVNAYRGIHASAASNESQAAYKYLRYGGIAAALATTALLTLRPIHSDDQNHPDQSSAIEHPGATQGVKVVTAEELAKHTTKEEGIWIVIEGNVWDVTEFIDMHPGGSKVILAQAGKDATKIFKPLHPPNTLESNSDYLIKIGVADPSMLKSLESPETDDELRIKEARENMMGVEAMVNLDDFEDLARKILSPAALAYYESGADDEWTMGENRSAYRKIRFRPRVLRNVKEVDQTTTILGVESASPFFISPAALAKLGHPLGEVNLTRGAGESGIIQCISSNASCSLDELAAERKDGQTLFWQLYVAADRVKAEKTIRHAIDLDMKSIWLTVDAPVGGKRERDMKEKIARDPPAKNSKPDPNAVSTSAVQFAYLDPTLNWTDLKWIQSLIDGRPLVIKGISCVEDAVLAAEHGCQGIVLSNHGGRQLDGARAPIDVLLEIRKERPDLFDKIEIFVDGGIRRGTDVLKALCLGAKAVGLGRPFLYAQSAYGADGVVKAVQIMEDEIATGMRLLGVNKISELRPELVEVLGA